MKENPGNSVPTGRSPRRATGIGPPRKAPGAARVARGRTPMNLRFRRAGAGDVEALQAIARRTIDTSYRSFIDDDTVDWFLSGPSDRYLAANVDKATVVTTDGSIAGFVVCKANLVDLILVDHGAHRRGIGTALLAHCESSLFRIYDTITLESFEGNDRANGFYRKNGWVRVGALPDPMSGARKWILEKRRDH